MAYVTIDPDSIEVGDPLKKELFDLIKDNFDDHETRIQTLSGGSGKVIVFDFVVNIGPNAGTTKLTYFKALQSIIITEVTIQIFEKTPAITGTISVDVKKNTDTNDANFTTILTTQPSVDIATDPDYTSDSGVINTGAQTIAAGSLVRLDITSLPSNLARFHVLVSGEF